MKKKHLLVAFASILAGAAFFFSATQLTDDDEIRVAVVAVVVEHPQIDADALDIDVNDGVVTITGSVSHDDIRAIIIEKVEKVDGVDRVIDKIIVEESNSQMPEVSLENP